MRFWYVNNNSQVHFKIQKFNSDKNNQLALSAATYHIKLIPVAVESAVSEIGCNWILTSLQCFVIYVIQIFQKFDFPVVFCPNSPVILK